MFVLLYNWQHLHNKIILFPFNASNLSNNVSNLLILNINLYYLFIEAKKFTTNSLLIIFLP